MDWSYMIIEVLESLLLNFVQIPDPQRFDEIKKYGDSHLISPISWATIPLLQQPLARDNCCFRPVLPTYDQQLKYRKIFYKNILKLFNCLCFIPHILETCYNLMFFFSIHVTDAYIGVIAGSFHITVKAILLRNQVSIFLQCTVQYINTKYLV